MNSANNNKVATETEILAVWDFLKGKSGKIKVSQQEFLEFPDLSTNQYIHWIISDLERAKRFWAAEDRADFIESAAGCGIVLLQDMERYYTRSWTDLPPVDVWNMQIFWTTSDLHLQILLLFLVRLRIVLCPR